MSFNPQPPNSGRPMPPNYGQAAGPQPSQGPQRPYGQPSYGQPPPYGQPNHGQQSGFGPPQPGVNPALFDSQALPDAAYGPGSELFWMAGERERTTAMWSHLGTLLFGYLPLIMFLVKKDESPFVSEHTRQGLNAMITNTIATTAAMIVLMVIGFVLAFITFGLGMFIVFGALVIPLVYTVFYIIAGIAANRGEGYKIPLVFQFVK
ncbi:DUF4870 domain-containing protein [Brevibacterium atlanticum]|uniref:DUF4870 domain-containing protein n=1 Tax=Brevibacterium atlanticum TaxID=2697563 RepID=UPI00142396B4|nr:DUF4870 domain-containing protein [Brevibacterium atlanticum]